MAEYKGSGTSPEDPITIRGVNSEIEGLSAERKFLHLKYGESHENWKISTMEMEVRGERRIDKFTIELKNGQIEYVFFVVKT